MLRGLLATERVDEQIVDKAFPIIELATAGVDAAAITCQDEAALEIGAVAEAAATAVARAVVQTSSRCQTTGTATANATTLAYSKAAAQASATAVRHCTLSSNSGQTQ